MDLLSKLLETLAPRCYRTTGLRAPADFAIRFPDFDGLKVLFIERGPFFCRPASGAAWIELAAGDVLVLARPEDYLCATNPESPVREARTTSYVLKDGLADYGGDRAVVYAGKMEPDAAMAELFFSALPPCAVLRADAGARRIGTLMQAVHAENLAPEAPGAAFAAERLSDLVMLEVLRALAAHPEPGQTGVLRAMTDPGLARALTALHNAPERPWTLAELAQYANMSRTRFAERFRRETGATPIDYLMRWRVRLAVQRLRDTDEPVKRIALELGFGSSTAFGAAFRRIEGVSPLESRARSRSESQLRLEGFHETYPDF